MGTCAVQDHMQAAISALGQPTFLIQVRGRLVALYHIDCLMALERPFGVELILTSPPYNIHKQYASSTDNRPDYFEWLRAVTALMGERVNRAGSVWLNVGYSSDHVPIAYRVWDASPRLKMHQEIVWSFTRGVTAKHYYAPRHETLLWLCRKDDASPRFDLEQVREPHDQSTCTCGTRNGKKRCNPNGKNPGDVWTIQTVTAGTGRASAERQPHPTQMPLALAERVVAGCGVEGGVLLDPFCGSGTSLVAAVQKGMDAIGFDISIEYLTLCKQRLETMLDR